ncbi:MAG: hypothetical protein HN919_11830 [Verrucomicrobia bacterium]|jgi:outer membrane murein-binding lipoprotein Lpp|nr:hypothetical protein [Verrucomicrobiota bacterium]MBT7066986.1 hypothetical protein [Verrucomicrobiota bacterium]MBT7699983.1 hypothetical protein [Verrucomicrobiota bacterium]
MRKIVAAIVVATVTCASVAQADPTLETRVQKLEKEVAELKAALAPLVEKTKAEQVVATQRSNARARMRKDSQLYTRDELREIETLYQVANRQWNSKEGKDSLKELIKKYDKANRTGCALLYLGQMTKGEEREKYLKQAIADFSDCFYGDGVQVGAYARYYLAYHYRESGDDKKAAELFEAMRTLYPSAIDHKGRRLADLTDN